MSKLLYGCHITIPGLQRIGTLENIQGVTYRANKRIEGTSTTAPKYITNGISRLEAVEGAMTRRAICTQTKYRTTYTPLRRGNWKGHETLIRGFTNEVTGDLEMDIPRST